LYPRLVPKLPDHMQSAPMGQEVVAREVVSAHQRERVLATISDVFAKRGYKATTVDDLLAAGKMGFGKFYSLFEGKEDCFLAAYERISRQAREQIAAASEPGEDWAARAYLGLRALLEALRARPLDARLVLIEAQSAGPTAIARYNGEMDAAVEWLRSARAQYPEAERLPEAFEQAAISGLAFFLQQCLLFSPRRSLTELLDETAGSILEPMIGSARLAELRREFAPPKTAE
jgi:AcrR family transcriptional regulator